MQSFSKTLKTPYAFLSFKENVDSLFKGREVMRRLYI